MYEALILVDNASKITTEMLFDELRRYYSDNQNPPSDISKSSESITLRWQDFILEVAREELPHVTEESAEIAVEFASENSEYHRIANCKSRFTTSGDHDPEMNYFNDYLFIVEALQRLGTVYPFDPSTGQFM